MKNIVVLVDTTRSMKTLGKKGICDNICQTIRLFPSILHQYADLHIQFAYWSGTISALKDKLESEKDNLILLLTDGFPFLDDKKATKELCAFCKRENRYFSIILCGADAQKVPHELELKVYEPTEIITAVTDFFLQEVEG